MVDDAQNQIQHVTVRLRDICSELRPLVLVLFGLERAIRSHVEHFQEQHPHLKVQLDLDLDGQMIEEHTRLALYRIYQNALSNVVRHAEANWVLVRLVLDAASIRLEIRDDGRGFEVSSSWIAASREGHFGLLGAAERAEAIGGQLEVFSAKPMSC